MILHRLYVAYYRLGKIAFFKVLCCPYFFLSPRFKYFCLFLLTSLQTAVFSRHSFLWFGLFFYHLQHTIFLMRWSTPIQFPDGHINTLYSGAVIRHVVQLCAFCEGSLRSKIYIYLIPLPSVPPLGSFPSLLLRQNDKTDRLKVCLCCRGLNHPRYSVGDYYQIVDPV